MSKLLYKLRKIGSYSIPSLTILLSIILDIIPYKVTNASLLFPFIVQTVIYYWAVYRPQLLPYFVILLLGLFKDILDNNALGQDGLSFLLFQAVIISQRRFLFNRAFIVVWAGFAFCLGIMLAVQFFFNIYDGSLSILFCKWLISVIAYVPIHRLLSKLKC